MIISVFIDNKLESDSLSFTAKIADFGLARTFNNVKEHYTKYMGTFVS